MKTVRQDSGQESARDQNQFQNQIMILGSQSQKLTKVLSSQNLEPVYETYTNQMLIG